MIFDSHAHYDDEEFEEDRELLLQSMAEHGVSHIVNIGASIESSKRTIALTEQYPFIYGAIGVHPEESAELNEEKLQWLFDHSKKEKIVAIGEIGLDYYWPEPAKEIQKLWFAKQLQLAKEVRLPVVIHSRDAAQDTLELMKKEQAQELTGVIHCYSYSKEIAREFLDWGYYFGIGGVLTFQNAKKLKEVVEFLPLEKILLETDCPYLAPVPYRGKRNSSLNLVYVVKEIASIKGMTEDEVIRITCDNAKNLYGIEDEKGKVIL